MFGAPRKFRHFNDIMKERVMSKIDDRLKSLEEQFKDTQKKVEECDSSITKLQEVRANLWNELMRFQGAYRELNDLKNDNAENNGQKDNKVLELKR